LHDIKIEDTILLIDTSRSMLRSDFSPNRLTIILKSMKNFIQTKFTIDPKDRISIISFGKNVKKLCSYSNDELFLQEQLKRVQISGNGNIREALALALQIIVEEMRKIGGKIHRILVFSDNKLNVDFIQLEKILKICKGLGLYIDCCQMGKPIAGKKNILKEISQLTNGEYGYFNNQNAIINAGKSFASKRMIKHTVDYFSPDKKDKSPPLMDEIALSLRRPSLLEIRQMMKNQASEREKCQICHSYKAPTGADFYTEGRFCPNCDRPMHLSCATMWATKSEASKDILRCPFCYFLLKLPKSAEKLFKKKLEDPKNVELLDEVSQKKAKMIEVHRDNVADINASCMYCYNIFLENYKVFKCENCGSYYHESCLQKMYNEIKSCRFCGSEIIYQK
jgi:hypothetical protein